MAEPLSPSISQGINRGEAAFLGDSSFDPIRFTEDVVRQEQQRRIGEKKENESTLKGLLDDNFKAKWDIDVLNEIQPQIDDFRGRVLQVFSTQGGRFTPEQKIKFTNEQKQIEQNVLLSNTVYDAYNRNVQKLEDARRRGGDGIDVTLSEQNLRTFADPMSNEETAKEVAQNYGGSVVKWRADNALKYGLAPSFSFDEYTDSIMKGESVSEMPIQDQKGSVITEKLPGGDYLYRVEKKLSPQQASTLASRVWNESNLQANKAKEMAFGAVDESFSIDNSGNVSFAIGGAITEEDGDKILEYAGKLEGLSKDEVRKRLAKGYLATTFERKSDKGVMTRKSRAVPQARTSGGGGGGKSWDERFQFTTGDLPETQIKNAIAEMGFQGNEPILPTNVPYTMPKGGKYVSILKTTPSKSEEESLQTLLKGKPIKVIGFVVNPNGSVTMDFSYQEKINMGRKGEKVKDLVEKNYDVMKDVETLTSVAASYGFDKAEDFLEFIKKRSGVKFEPPKTRTQASKAKTATPANSPKKKKLPGT
jgi:hypothetical protein